MVLGDMGGTLADVSHRLHWVRGGKKNWKKVFREMHKDPPNPSIAIWYAICGWRGTYVLSGGGRELLEVAIREPSLT